MCESWTCHLSLQNGACENALPSHQILAEELHDDVGDVGDVDLVDETID